MAEVKTMTMEEMMEKAQSADMVDVLQQLGLELEGDGAQKHMKGRPHMIIDIEHNVYMDYASGKGGSPVDFLANLHQSNQEDEARALCGMMEAGSLKTYYNPKAFIAPDKHETNKHVYAYLTKEKGIDGEVVNKAMNRGNLYETRNEYMNADGELKQQYRCVFVGMDSNRNVKNAVVQAAYGRAGQKPFQYQVKNSHIEYGFNMYGRNENLFVFRDPVDALREASLEKMNGMDWRRNHRLALPVLDIASIERYAKQVRGIDNIYLCLPDDQTSQFHAKRMREELSEKGFNVISIPMTVSFEEQLAARRAEEQAVPTQNEPNKQEQRSAGQAFALSTDRVPDEMDAQNDLEILEENTVDDRVFVLAYDPNAERPYFVYEAVEGEKADMESFSTRETALEMMEDRIDAAEEAEEMSR